MICLAMLNYRAKRDAEGMPGGKTRPYRDRYSSRVCNEKESNAIANIRRREAKREKSKCINSFGEIAWITVCKICKAKPIYSI